MPFHHPYDPPAVGGWNQRDAYVVFADQERHTPSPMKPASSKTTLLLGVYAAAVYISTPIILLYLAWRGFRNGAYWRRWGERLGWRFPEMPEGGIVVHAVSMGEVNGVSALVRQLRQRWPQRPLLFTCTTPTGSQRILTLFPPEQVSQHGVYHCYLPIDLPGAMARLYRRLKPSLVVVMETEIWPNFYHNAARRGVPLVMVNARLSKRSASGYRRYLPQARMALAELSGIAAQTEEDAQRFVVAGAAPERVVCCGNLKVDLQLPDGIHQRAQLLAQYWGETRPVWLAASTHEGEETELLAIQRKLLQFQPQALLILVPRHPERFERVVQLLRQENWHWVQHSRRDEAAHGISAWPGAQVLVVDAMGVLLEYAAAAQMIFVGGTLVPVGGHNPLEPAALAKPVVVGPWHESIHDLMRLLQEAGGATALASAAELEHTVLSWMQQPDTMAAMGQRAADWVQSQRGAVTRCLKLIEALC